jgi:hypothetical protein
MRNALLLCLALFCSCGDNIAPPDSRGNDHQPEVVLPEPTDVDPGDGTCADYDINVACPPRQDAGSSGPDASSPDPGLDPELKASCCHALLDGSPPKFECGYPPGICHSGRRDLHCGELTFTLCNP